MPYTPAQVSDMLAIPSSSLRRLSREFSEYLSKQRGRNRKYTEADIAVLKRIREATAHGVTLEQIKLELSIPQAEERPEQAEDTLSLVPTISAELERLDTSYNALRVEIERMRRENDELRAADRARLRRLEEWASLPWYIRLFKRPPQ